MKGIPDTTFEAIVMGASTGGVEIFTELFGVLPENFVLPIVIVQHLPPDSQNYLSEFLGTISPLPVKQAEDKEPIKAGIIYLAPPDYHLLVENDRTFSLSVSEKVNYARPAIDVLFETAAAVYGDKLIGIIFSGANRDGSSGLRRIRELGGYCIVQDPATALANQMPRAALAATAVDRVLSVPQIITFLCTINRNAMPRINKVMPQAS